MELIEKLMDPGPWLLVSSQGARSWLAVWLALVPATHAAGLLFWGLGPATRRCSTSLARLFAFPFRGGHRHAAFALIGWVLWAASALAAIPMWLVPLSPASLGSLLQGLWHALRLDTHLDVVSGAAAASSFIAQLFLVQAMLVYEPAPWGHGKGAAADQEEEDQHLATSADSTPRSAASHQEGSEHLSTAAHSETEAGSGQPGQTGPRQAVQGQSAVNTNCTTSAAPPATPQQAQPADGTNTAEDEGSDFPAAPRRVLARSLDGGVELVSKGIHALVEGGAAGAQTARRAINRYAAAAAVVCMGLLFTVTGVLVLLSVEHMPDVPSKVVYCCLALVCLIVGASSTHGLAGYLRWGSPGRSHAASPGRGRSTGRSASRRGSPAPESPLPGSGMSGSVRRRYAGQRGVDTTGSGSRHASPAPLRAPTPASSSSPDRSPRKGQGGDVSLLRVALEQHQVMYRSASLAPLWGEPEDADLETSLAIRRVDTFDSLAGASARTGRSGGQGTGTGTQGDGSGVEADKSSVEDGDESWAFWQPFAGGTAFVVTQAIGWTLFALTAAYIGALAKLLVTGVMVCLRCWLLGASVLMIATQLSLATSLMLWRARKAAHRFIHRVTHPGAPAPAPTAAPTRTWLIARVAAARATWQKGGLSGCAHAIQMAVEGQFNLHMPLVIMYMPIHCFFAFFSLSIALCPPHWAVAMWLGFLPIYYALTLVGEPQHTGRKTWPLLREWLSRNAEQSLTFWFGGIQVVRDSDPSAPPPDPKGKYIFGFHPHGLYPTGAGFLPLLPSFRKLLPGIMPITLTASVMYYVPAIKDLSLWLGFRQVSRRTFLRALKDVGSVIICPGGQAELVYTHVSHKRSDKVTVTAAVPLQEAASDTVGEGDASDTFVAAPGSKSVVAEAPKSPFQDGVVCGQGVFDQLSYVSCTQEASLASTTIDSEMTEAGCAGTATAQGTADASTQHEEAKHIKQEEVEVSSACVAVDVSTSSHAMEPALAATTATAGFSSHKVQQRVQQLLDQQQVVEEQTMSQQGEDDAASDAVKDQAGLHEIASTTSSVRTVTCSVELSEGSGDSETAGQKAAAVQPDDPKQQQQQEQHHQVSELVIYAGHKGFVRLAIEQQASLVPVLALGEVLQLRNVIHWPSLQRWSYKRVGFPFPFIIAGRWSLPFLPIRTPLIYVVGDPIPPPPLPADGGSIPQSLVDDMHQRFYSQLAAMFKRHAHRHPSFKHTRLTMLHAHEDSKL